MISFKKSGERRGLEEEPPVWAKKIPAPKAVKKASMNIFFMFPILCQFVNQKNLMHTEAGLGGGFFDRIRGISLERGF